MTFAVVASLLVLTISIAFVVILRPALRPDHMGAVAVASLGLALGLGGAGGLGTVTLPGLELGLSLLCLLPALTMTRGFRRLDMLALLFHRDFGVKGADIRALKNEIATASITVALLGVATIRLDGLLGAGHGLTGAMALVVFAANPVLRFLMRRLWTGKVDTVLPDRLVAPDLRPGPVATPDLVVIYLEGTDRRFADPDAFGAIYRKLDAFAAEGLSFTRIGQIVGTGWSTAGMTATQAGVMVPARGMKFQTGLDNVRRFMPGVTFLGDILASKSYSSRFIVGGDPAFGGLGALYSTHRVQTIGMAEMAQMFPADEVKAARIEWFLDDQMVLDTARRVHHDLVQRSEPLALIIETIAPHGPKGYVSRRNSRTGRAEATKDFARTVECLIDEVMEFVTDIRAASAAKGRDLRVVLLSDHLNHCPTLPDGGPDYAGFNTVILWGDTARPPRQIDRLGSMVDVFPTLLDWLGWSAAPVAAGLGRSLLSDAPTLVEEFGIAGLDAMIVADPRLGQRLWAETPAVGQGAGCATA